MLCYNKSNPINKLTEKDLDELFEELDLFNHGFIDDDIIDRALKDDDFLEEILDDFYWHEDDDEHTQEDYEVLNDELFKKYFP